MLVATALSPQVALQPNPMLDSDLDDLDALLDAARTNVRGARGAQPRSIEKQLAKLLCCPQVSIVVVLVTPSVLGRARSAGAVAAAHALDAESSAARLACALLAEGAEAVLACAAPSSAARRIPWTPIRYNHIGLPTALRRRK